MDLWPAFAFFYALTIAIETPILLVGLSPQHDLRRRAIAGIWLTACTYPMVFLVFPAFFDPTTETTTYILVAETFAPVAECLLFWLAFSPLRQPVRDLACVAIANFSSYGVGELLSQTLGEDWWRGFV